MTAQEQAQEMAKKAAEDLIQQWLTDSMTPDRGYTIDGKEVLAVIPLAELLECVEAARKHVADTGYVAVEECSEPRHVGTGNILVTALNKLSAKLTPPA